VLFKSLKVRAFDLFFGGFSLYLVFVLIHILTKF